MSATVAIGFAGSPLEQNSIIRHESSEYRIAAGEI